MPAEAEKAPPRQVAGHPGVLLASEHAAQVVKQCPAHEAHFYELVHRGTEPAHALMRACMPQCFGIRVDGESVPGWAPLDTDAPNAVRLENLTHPFVHADVCDIKLGTLLYDERPGYTDDAKIARMQHKARTTTSGIYGMRIAGWTTWDGANYEFVGKEPGKAAQSLEDMAELLARALRTHAAPRRHTIARALLPRIEALRARVAQVPAQLRSMSVLLVVEGDDAALDRAQDTPAQVCDARLIDFAHSRWSVDEGVDHGVQRGLATLAQILELWC